MVRNINAFTPYLALCSTWKAPTEILSTKESLTHVTKGPCMKSSISAGVAIVTENFHEATGVILETWKYMLW